MKQQIISSFLSFLFIVISAATNSQSNFTMYEMTKLAQSHYENPSNAANGRMYFALALGKHSFGLNNSGFTLNNILKQRSQDDSLMIDANRFFNGLGRRNYIVADIRNEIIGFGVNTETGYYSLSATNRIFGGLYYPRDLGGLLAEGNGRSYLGERISLDGLGIKLDAYMEYAFGYSGEINENLRVGGRLKVLSGYANFATQQSKLGVFTNEENFAINIDGQMKFSTAGLISDMFDTTKSGEIDFYPENLINFRNFGIALDLGATYKFNENIELNASLLDLGFISWKDNPINYQTDNLDFNFKGVEMKEFFGSESDTSSNDYLSELGDSLFSKINNDFTNNKYNTMLSSRFYLGARYKVTDWFALSLTSHNQFVGRKLRMAGILSGTIQLKNWLGFTVNYAAYGRAWNNIGIGLSLRGGPFQFFAMTDNILALNYPKAKNAHVSFGINLLIGKLDKKSEQEKIKHNSRNLRWRTYK